MAEPQCVSCQCSVCSVLLGEVPEQLGDLGCEAGRRGSLHALTVREDDPVLLRNPDDTQDLLPSPKALALEGSPTSHRSLGAGRTVGRPRKQALSLPGPDRLHRIVEGLGQVGDQEELLTHPIHAVVHRLGIPYLGFGNRRCTTVRWLPAPGVVQRLQTVELTLQSRVAHRTSCRNSSTASLSTNRACSLSMGTPLGNTVSATAVTTNSDVTGASFGLGSTLGVSRAVIALITAYLLSGTTLVIGVFGECFRGTR